MNTRSVFNRSLLVCVMLLSLCGGASATVLQSSNYNMAAGLKELPPCCPPLLR